MQLEYFDYLCKINQCHSIARAAKELYLGPATLRSILKRMEEELGFTIFVREHNRLELTAEGEEAIALAREIAALYDEIRHLARQRGTASRTVKLLCSPSINCALSGPLSAAMGAAGDLGNLLIAETAGIEVSTKILQNEFNIALTYFTPNAYRNYQVIAGKYHIQVHQAYRDHLYLLTRRDNPLAARAEIDHNRLRGREFALLSHFVQSNDPMVSIKEIQGHNRITIFSNVPLIKRAVLEQDMFSILSGYAIHFDDSVDNSLLCAIPLSSLKEINEMDLCLIHREKSSLSPAERYVVDFIENYFSSLAHPPFSPEFQPGTQGEN